jgi:isoleucyl-tRNA synthetase
VAMVDYREEIRLGKQILARVIEAYRKIRNTMRYLVANLYDFDPAVDRLPAGRMEDVDRFVLARYGALASRVVRAYEEYDYPPIFQAFNSFTTVDLSSFYNDISKDRLYTFGARSAERRSAQTAMYVMADGLTRLLAPILPVTADELWRHLPGRPEPSVHLALFPDHEALDALQDDALVERWTRLMALRERVLAKIEPLRKDKVIGSSLQARVRLAGTPTDLAWLTPHAADLPMLFIVSDVAIEDRGAASGDGESPAIAIERADGVKCERCWRYVRSVSDAAAWSGLCDRCQHALAEQVHG